MVECRTCINGFAKNSATRRNFKSVVRILKRLRNEMEDDGIVTAQPIPSYLIECLTWNVPDDKFSMIAPFLLSWESAAFARRFGGFHRRKARRGFTPNLIIFLAKVHSI